MATPWAHRARIWSSWAGGGAPRGCAPAQHRSLPS